MSFLGQPASTGNTLIRWINVICNNHRIYRPKFKTSRGRCPRCEEVSYTDKLSDKSEFWPRKNKITGKLPVDTFPGNDTHRSGTKPPTYPSKIREISRHFGEKSGPTRGNSFRVLNRKRTRLKISFEGRNGVSSFHREWQINLPAKMCLGIGFPTGHPRRLITVVVAVGVRSERLGVTDIIIRDESRTTEKSG